MKVGIEEEFIVADPETLGFNPGAFRLANGLVYKNSTYIKKCNVELPLHSGSLSKIFSNLKKAFCVFEIKTDPYEDIDSLQEELVFHRKQVSECAKENHLLVLPCGLHPAHRSSDFIDNCAALHVHIDYSKDRFNRLISFIPFLIAISVNSPFLDGSVNAMTNRMLLSPHVNTPNMKNDNFERNADIIHNPTLRTVEVKVFDTQVTVDESIGLASIVKTIVEDQRFSGKISKEVYLKKRERAIIKGFDYKEGFIDNKELTYLKEHKKNNKKLLMSTGSDWQIEVFKKYGLASVVSSLSASFEKDRRVVKKNKSELKLDKYHSKNLWYIISYYPFLILEKYKKYRQDIVSSGGLKNI
jgi:hypothetical protein